MGHASDEATPQILSEIPGGFQIGRYRFSPERPKIGSAAWFAEVAVKHRAALSRPYTIQILRYDLLLLVILQCYTSKIELKKR